MKEEVWRGLKVPFDFGPQSRYHESLSTHTRTHTRCTVYVDAEPPSARVRGERRKCVFSVSGEETYKSRQSRSGFDSRRTNRNPPPDAAAAAERTAAAL